MSPAPPTPEATPPGKTRTWWHPLLTALLRWQLAGYYKVEEEVNVGSKPLQIDVLLLREQRGELPESVRRITAGLAEYLNAFTLIEFKSPSDTLRAGDFQTFLAYALLYRAQHRPLLPPGQLNLLVIAPRLTKPYRRELALCGVTPRQEEPGVWRLQGGTAGHATRVLETQILQGVQHPLLTVLSPQLLADVESVSRQLRAAGYAQLLVYMTQQIQQFQLQGETFAMQHLAADDEMKEMWRNIARNLTPEDRLLMFKGLTPEERLEGLAPEERLAGLAPEERLEGLTAAEREQLLALLQQQQTAPKAQKGKRGKKA